MKTTLALLAAAALLTGCGGGGGGNVSDGATPAAPVATASAPAGQNWTDTVSQTAEGFVMGNPNAPLKLVEYGARTCPTCGAFARDSFGPLTENYVATGKVSFEFRDFLVHGVQDVPGALIGACGGAAPFFPLLEQMYGAQEDQLNRLQQMTPAQQQRLQALPAAQLPTALAEVMGLIDFARQRGLPEAKARACLTDQAALERLAKGTQAKTEDGTVTGTPTLILNGRKLDNVLTWPALEQALKTAGA